MKIGTVFPQLEIGNDVGAIKAYAQAAEALGFDSIHSADHVVHIDNDYWKRPNVPGYNTKTQLIDPFVLFTWMGAVTKKVTFVGGILLLPERETCLVAKQAASLDYLTGGRLRLCMGIGNFKPEFEALRLGDIFHVRGKYCEEQIALLRELWTKETVQFEGKWHTVKGFGSNPLPVQRPIPIWVGGYDDRVHRRAGRVADGFLFARERPTDATAQIVEKIRGYAKAAGRNPDKLGIEGRVGLVNKGTIEQCISETFAWKETGVSHVVLMSIYGGLQGPDQHIQAMRRYMEGVSSVAD